MKKATIAILSILVGAVAIVGLSRSGVIDFSPDSTSKEDPLKTPSITCVNKKATYYNEDLPSFSAEGVPFEVTYSSPSLQVEKAAKPNASGNWIANVKTLATPKYEESSSYYPFKWVGTKATTIHTYFEGKDDTWGGSHGNSINTSASTGILVDKGYFSYIQDQVVGLDTTIYSFYRISRYNFDAKRKFTIYASNDILNYGVFSFWLTDCDDTYKEVTMEVMKNESIFATGLDPDNYFEHKKANATDYCDGFMHRYDIQLFTDKVEFSIDNQIVHTISENIPNITYCKVQFGLLVPSDPFWSGTPELGDKDVTVRVSQFEMYDPSTGALVLD